MRGTRPARCCCSWIGPGEYSDDTQKRSLVERDAPPLLQPGSRCEHSAPFAKTSSSSSRAVDRFDAMGLDWHAEQSRSLLAPT
jgi:hypothetical protein